MRGMDIYSASIKIGIRWAVWTVVCGPMRNVSLPPLINAGGKDAFRTEARTVQGNVVS